MREVKKGTPAWGCPSIVYRLFDNFFATEEHRQTQRATPSACTTSLAKPLESIFCVCLCSFVTK
jgi:hypothetical protein